ncbi:hypothetical protein HQN90_00020 [Paenibacillus alba]|nr:hypothetical protein [Paenibacillus alba]
MNAHLHVPKDSLVQVLSNIEAVLKPGEVFEIEQFTVLPIAGSKTDYQAFFAVRKGPSTPL